ncbi:hypothetical protein ACIQHZ_31455 [Streptomyces halstedii]|uniref:hypothetical protein n=1 Tax=Streptomyces halstedii TaxID=1944 RepID=UPI003809417E
MTEPRMGDIGLTKIGGLAGLFVNVGQWFVGDFAPIQHALIYIGGGWVVQAMPSGAEMIPLEEASPVVMWSTGLIPLTHEERVSLANKAYDLVGTPYGFLDYLSIALERLGVRPRWVLERVISSKTLICSQLVVEAYLRAGIELFPGEFPGDQTPGDLYRLLKDLEAND